MNLDRYISAQNKDIQEEYLKGLSKREVFVFRLRAWLNKKFNVWDIWDILPRQLYTLYYDKLRPLLKPQHRRITNAIPRTWTDLSELIVIVNFEIIKSFYEDEFLNANIDWDYDKAHRDFASWIKEAYNYITVERLKLEQQISDLASERELVRLPKTPEYDSRGVIKQYEWAGTGFEKKDLEYYNKITRIDKKIEKADTKYLAELIKYKNYFWT